MGADAALLRRLADFRKELVQTLGGVEAMVLFGSMATGRAGPDSDADILVVSRAFEGMSKIRRGVLVRRTWNLDLPVDFLCYTPEEFERLRRQVSIVSEALREGVEVPA